MQREHRIDQELKRQAGAECCDMIASFYRVPQSVGSDRYWESGDGEMVCSTYSKPGVYVVRRDSERGIGESVGRSSCKGAHSPAPSTPLAFDQLLLPHPQPARRDQHKRAKHWIMASLALTCHQLDVVLRLTIVLFTIYVLLACLPDVALSSATCRALYLYRIRIVLPAYTTLARELSYIISVIDQARKVVFHKYSPAQIGHICVCTSRWSSPVSMS